MENTPKLGMPEISESQSGKSTTHNEALRDLDALVQLNVIDIASEPPSGPSDGDTYIVGDSSSSSSEWNGQDDKIAYYENTAWSFLSPDEGWRAFVQDEDEFYVYLGASLGWIKESSLIALTDLSDTPSTYSGQAYKVPRVKGDESGIEFVYEINLTNLAGVDIHVFVDGVPGGSEVMLRYPMVRKIQFPDDFSGSRAKSGVAAGDSAGAEFLIKKNGTEFGQMIFASGETTATFATDSSYEDFDVGDVLTVVAPASPDSALSGVSFTLKGFKLN